MNVDYFLGVEDTLKAGLHLNKEDSVFANRKGTLVRASVLVFIGGALMGLSRACRMPAMVIIGRFITGLYSGRPAKRDILTCPCWGYLVKHPSIIPSHSCEPDTTGKLSGDFLKHDTNIHLGSRMS